MDETVVTAAEGTPYRLAWGWVSVPVRRIWATGLALARDDARRMPGLVRLHRGAELVATGLVVSHEIAGDEHRFRFKRLTFCETGPARDWAPGGAPHPDRPSISPRPLAFRRLRG